MSPGSPGRARQRRPPSIPETVVTRPRLNELITTGAAQGIVAISAPIGFGATTAVAQAFAGRGDIAWVSLTALEADPQIFATQVLTAVHDPRSPAPPTVESSPLELIAAALDDMDDMGVEALILDGLNARLHSPALDLVRYLGAHLPDSSGLVLTTHDRPSTLPLPALSGRLTVIAEEDLALRPDEAVQVVLETCPQVSSATVDALVLAADGWVAPCREAAQFAVRRPTENPAAWLRTEGAAAVTQAALHTTTKVGAQLLTDTAFLEELDSSLCAAVLDDPQRSTHLLDAHLYGSLLSSAVQISTPGGPEMQVWVRHPLLTSGLRARAFGRDLSTAHRRAADWYRAAGHFDRTMEHLVSAGDFDTAGDYLKAHEDTLYESGDATRAASWYSVLPAETWGRRGWHLLRSAWGRAISGDVRGAEVGLEQLLGHLASSPALHPEEAVLHGEAALVSAYVASMRGDPDAVIVRSTRAIDLITEDSPPNSIQLAPILLAKGLLMRGDSDEARTQLERLATRSFPSDLLREGTLGGLRARSQLVDGRVNLARQTARRAHEWLVSQHLAEADVAQFSLSTIALAVDIESGSPLRAEGHFDGIIDTSLAQGRIADAIDALYWRARGLTATGDLGGALASIGQARGLLFESSPGSSLSRVLDMQEAFVRHLAGDAVRAERLIQGLPRSDDRMLLWARVTLRRQGSRALRMLADTQPTTPRRQLEQQVLLAQSALTRSSRLAEGHLIKVADIAETHGMGLALLGSSRQLLDIAILVGTRTGHDTLVALAEGASQNFASGAVRRTPVDEAADATPLSPGEIQLLAFLPHRGGNAEIAERLGVSINTVKTRLSRLYRKLGATKRDEAVAIARSRGLLP